MVPLGLCAARQILIHAKKTYTAEEELQVIKNIQDSANKFGLIFSFPLFKFKFIGLIPVAEENLQIKNYSMFSSQIR